MDKRAEVQRQMSINQIREVNRLITQLRDAIHVADQCGCGLAVIARTTAVQVVRNLEDLEKRFLVGLI